MSTTKITKTLGYRVDATLKNEYDMAIQDKFGHKQNRCGSELEKAMKIYLTLEGKKEYKDDPDVVALLDKARENQLTHTKHLKI